MHELPNDLTIIITCEHGGNQIPPDYASLFASAPAQAALNSHRGYDPGTLELAGQFSRELKAPLFHSSISRLLVELNRSLGHRQLFSEWTRGLSPDERQKLIDDFYRPYHDEVEGRIALDAVIRPVLHVSVHSFTPVLNGKRRSTEIGLLFDPTRQFESAFCRCWKRTIQTLCPGRVVHFNRPYRGTSDGLTVALRRRFPDLQYAGIELEVNQKFVGDPSEWKSLQTQLAQSLRTVLKSC